MYNKIMVPLDGSELAECTLPHVEAFITGCQVDTIVFVRVIESTPVTFGSGTSIASQNDFERITASSKRIEEERKSSAEEYLKQVVSQLKQDGVKFQTEVLMENRLKLRGFYLRHKFCCSVGGQLSG